MNRKKLIVILATLVLSIPIAAHAQPVAGSSHSEPSTLVVETLLSKLGYWILKVDGVADVSTRHAITAFQKVERRKVTGVMRAADLEALQSAQPPNARHKTGGEHIEVDIGRQVLFVVGQTGVVSRILPISSGNEKRYFDQGKWQIAHTPRGSFKIIRKVNGVRKASLGDLYYPNYFVDGVAIHGSNSIPKYPASHGCVRIPRFADRAFFQIATLGMKVFVYD